jgi:hypothetical protein
MFTTLSAGCLASAGPPNEVGGRPQDSERRSHVDIDHRVPLLVGGLLYHVVPGIAGVVDNDVDAGEGFEGGADEALPEVRFGDVADAGDRLGADLPQLVDRVVGDCRVEVVDHDARAFTAEFERNLSSDAAPGSRDEGNLSVKFGHGRPSGLACGTGTPGPPPRSPRRRR